MSPAAPSARGARGMGEVEEAGNEPVAAPPLTHTRHGYGGPPNTIRPIGGLNPIPSVRITGITGTSSIWPGTILPPTRAT